MEPIIGKAKEKIMNIQPRDIIALVVIIGGMILISFHIDGIIGGLLVSVVAFYFGLNTPTPKAG